MIFGGLFPLFAPMISGPFAGNPVPGWRRFPKEFAHSGIPEKLQAD
jgi:hypothetical protein